jgi:protein transport protein SEC61 subunit gamma-like protein
MRIRIRERLESYKRVIKISRKPDKDELLTTAKICAIGVLLIGAIGFIFYLISVLIG